jgi:hypothetical protein
VDGAESDSAEHIDVRRHFVLNNLKLISAAARFVRPAKAGLTRRLFGGSFMEE